ncbi:MULTISPECIES: WHG domain-containing protein [unclassified Cellulomonas]|uniref:WHG domain-containing protein n=1 Tax=unclassified Cellulomonas TaxID=2620175 RepID=UPI00198A36BD|nr:WHG domain-containing protein [Cellulomonas sp. ES6]MBD3780232.1 WHG domain-containing protein [Micrococcales bacterium]WHP16116.1 WHG domain-containing protein [Cellulomonas sp. ES6]
MPRAGLSAAAVSRVALGVVDAGGPGGFADLTLARVAAEAGVATPSLYKHVGSLAALRREVAVLAVRDLTEQLVRATLGRSGPDAVRALCHAMRDYAHAHPGRYAAVQVAADPADPDDAGLAAAGAEVVGVITAVLRGFELPEERAVDAVRAVRAAVHGYVTLELGGGFRLPQDLDRSFAVLVDLVVAGIEALAAA